VSLIVGRQEIGMPNAIAAGRSTKPLRCRSSGKGSGFATLAGSLANHKTLCGRSPTILPCRGYNQTVGNFVVAVSALQKVGQQFLVLPRRAV
jgi:hypothetical protein